MIVLKYLLWLMFLSVYNNTPFVNSEDVSNLEHIVELRCQLISQKFRYNEHSIKYFQKCKTEKNPQSNQNTPEVPTNLKVVSAKNPKEKRFEIKWELPYGSESEQKKIKYHIETRFYLGVFKPVNDLYYSPWQWQHLEKNYETTDPEKKTALISYHMKVRRGYWYQFRVAAINTNGYREMSGPSKPFKIEMDPKMPAEAKFLMIDSYDLSNTKNTINVTLSWCQAKSDVPVKRYKISWALHIMDKRIDSVLLKHVFVSGGHQSVKIPNLRINSQYFIFMQAISIYGNKKLKSNFTYLEGGGNFKTFLPIIINNTNSHKCMNMRSNGSFGVQPKDMENMIDAEFIDTIQISYHISTKNFNNLIVTVDNVGSGTHLEICKPNMCPWKSILIFPEKKRYTFTEMDFNQKYFLKIYMNQREPYMKNFTTPLKQQLLTDNSTIF
ncbi:KAL1 family protein [Megaselia abdita]